MIPFFTLAGAHGPWGRRLASGAPRGARLLALLLAAVLGLSSSPSGAGPPGSRLGEGLDLVVFLGGAESDPFSAVVRGGAESAREALGCKVRYLWSGWNIQTMLDQFREAAAAKPDGIAVMGHPGVAAYAPLIDAARAKGILVTSLNADLSSLEQKYKAAGFGYVGEDLYAAGETLAKAAAAMAGLQKGDRVMVWGLPGQSSRGERTRGAVEALGALGCEVDVVAIADAVNADPSLGEAFFIGYLKDHPDLKMVVTDHGSLTGAMTGFLKNAKKRPGEPFVAGFDLNPGTIEGLRSGRIGLVQDQQPWLQGYLAVLQLVLSKRFGFSGLRVDTGGALIDKNLVDFVAPLANQGVR